ncbi:hypothetical protein [Acetobacter conturbans]|uniref:Uncharacterized protein n=1 Tax=Acetobacter conturbans TaxID=1737472 RepID=A0ABX0JYS8_9PROT|nr:hypothetical protein [Acetobacter conturbans]NHN87994.1 hypothetical protein [Acetobacter conturbans]
METVLTQHIDTPEGRSLWRDLLGRQPGLGAVLNYLRNSHDASAQQGLLWYQQELLDRWFFRIPSPLTGSMIHSGDSWACESGITCFRFPDAPGLFLVSSEREKGFPINALLLAEAALCLSFGSRENALTSGQALDLLEWGQVQPPRFASSISALVEGSASLTPSSKERAALRALVDSPHARGPAPVVFIHERLADICDEISFLRNWPVKQSVAAEEENQTGRVCFWLGSPL